MEKILNKIPLPDCGEYLFYPSGDGCELALYNNIDFCDFDEYTKNLIGKGFVLINTNAIENNHFAFFTNNSLNVNVGYFECDKTMRIVVDDNLNFPPYTPVKVLNKRAKTTLWQYEVDHSLIDCGMCYIIRTVTGKFFIIDSPHTYSINDCERIHSFLRERTPAGEKIHIAGWFFSHGHEDHITQFISFLNFYSEDTIIDNVYFNLISVDHRDNGDWMECIKFYYEMFYNTLKNHPQVKVVRVHTGQTFYVDNLKFDILCSHEDVFPGDNTNFNDSSVVLMVTGENTKILFPGDAGHVESYILEARYPQYLKADIVQQAHHGHFGTTDNFYRLVDAKVALFPVTQIKFDEELDHWSANRVSLDIADEYYIASNGTVEIELPYQKGNTRVLPDETFESFKGIYDLWTYEYTAEYKEKLYNEYLQRGGKPLEEYKDGF